MCAEGVQRRGWQDPTPRGLPREKAHGWEAPVSQGHPSVRKTEDVRLGSYLVPGLGYCQRCMRMENAYLEQA